MRIMKIAPFPRRSFLFNLFFTTCLILLPCIGIAAAGVLEEVVDPEITQAEISRHIKFLASDELEGREAGTPGALVAAEYIVEQLRAAGVEPLGDEKTFYQNFSLPKGYRPLATTSVTVHKRRRQSLTFSFGKDITVFSSSAAGRAEGTAVFAGYGVSAPFYGYDDYEGFDVTGKIVIVLRGLPGGKRGPVSDRSAQRNFGSFRSKQETAAGLGAAALIVINDPAEHGSKKKDTLIKGGRDPQGGIPFIHMTYRAGGKLLSGTGISLGQTQSRIDKSKKPASKELDEVQISLVAGIEPIELEVRNVVGRLRSRSKNRIDEVLVIGAHFDHVGLGNFGSRGGSKARGKVHNGADDNASGTAAVIEMAGYFSARTHELRRDLVFAAFTAEEMGLHGSQHYVDSPPIPLGQTAAMINLDMIGRLGRSKLFVGGMGTSPIFENLLTEANRKTRIKLTLGKGGKAPTDSASFYSKEIPVLFFFTGLHKDYHLPSDDWKLVDKRGTEKVIRLAAEVALLLATNPERPPFTRADSGGFQSGPFLGMTVTQKADGVYVTHVERRSPASRAGFKLDDKVLEFEGQQVQTAADFYGIKAQCPPGKKVAILIRRQGRAKTMKVKLGKA